MLRVAICTCALLLACDCAQAGDKPTKEKCEAWFLQADKDKNGFLSGEELSLFADSMGLAKAGADLNALTVSNADWMAACEEGKFGVPEEHGAESHS